MKYLMILVGPEGEEQDQRSPEEIREAMGAWNDYTNALVEAGAYIAGEGLQPSATATTVTHTDAASASLATARSRRPRSRWAGSTCSTAPTSTRRSSGPRRSRSSPATAPRSGR